LAEEQSFVAPPSGASGGRTKVVPRILGGIGNQLFSYAAARRLALANGAELVIDDVSGFVRDHEYQREYQLGHFRIPCRKTTKAERLSPFSRVRRQLKRLINSKRRYDKRSYIMQQGIDFDPRVLTIRPKGTLYIEGYWQSERYFKDAEAQIREDLRILPPEDEVNEALAERIGGCLSVALHMRFFDTPTEAGRNNAPSDYYARAIEKMETFAPGAHYFVFSDEPAAARDRLTLAEDRFTVVSHNQGDENAYADLWLMTQCKHFVIANSTFSWWGAWLAESQDKRVIAPGYEKRDGKAGWGFDGLLPDEWTRL